MRLGFTTNIFARPLASGEVNLGGLVDFAEEEGFVTIELRDDDTSYGLDEVEDFVKDAGAKSIEVTYAIKNDMFLSGDEELFKRGLERAALCGDGAVMRCLAAQSALSASEKKGYTAEDLERIVSTVAEYSKLAEEAHISLALEHAKEPLFGDGLEYFGLADICDALESAGDVPAAFGITFDPANAVFRSLCKAPTEPERVFDFLDRYSQFIALVHYKTTSGGEATDVIQTADVDNEELFARLATTYQSIVCLEIPPAADLSACRENVDISLEYLRKLGIMGYFA